MSTVGRISHQKPAIESPKINKEESPGGLPETNERDCMSRPNTNEEESHLHHVNSFDPAPKKDLNRELLRGGIKTRNWNQNQNRTNSNCAKPYQ